MKEFWGVLRIMEPSALDSGTLVERCHLGLPSSGYTWKRKS